MKISIKRAAGALVLVCTLTALTALAWRQYRSRPVYHDRFAQNEASEWIPLGGAWQLRDDAVINRSDERGAKLLTGSNLWRDYQLSADVKLVGHEGDVGLIVRSSDQEHGVDAYNGYYVGLRSSDSALIAGRADHGWLEGRPVSLQTGVKNEVWYRLRVVAVGCNIGAEAIDLSTGKSTFIAMHEDSCPAAGAIGLRSMGTGGAWRHIEVKPANESDWQTIVSKTGEVEAPIYPLHEAEYNRMRDAFLQGTLKPSQPFSWRTETGEPTPAPSAEEPQPLIELAAGHDRSGEQIIRGVVTLTNPVYIQDQTGSMAVEIKGRQLNLGDEVEFGGRVEMRDGFPIFAASAFRLLWDRTPAIAASVTSTQAATGGFEGSLIDVRGILSAKHIDANGVITLDMRDDAQNFRAVMRGGLSQRAFRSWQPGAELRLRGICTMDASSAGVVGLQSTGATFYILLRSVDDVEVLQAPPFWNIQRIVQMGLAAVFLTVLFAMLYVRLERAKHEAVLAERERLAHDMHDTLAQSFAGVGFHLQGVCNSFDSGTSDIDGVMKKIAVARDLVTATHREASASIAALHPDADGGLDLLFALERAVHSMLDGDALPIQLERRGNAQRMSMSTRDLLFQIGREAMTNVLRHSQATEATLSLYYEAKHVSLEVRDNGVGFDPAVKASGFGLRTMQRRCEKIGAVLKIVTDSNGGSTIAVYAPYGVEAGLWQRLRSLLSTSTRRFSE